MPWKWYRPPGGCPTVLTQVRAVWGPRAGRRRAVTAVSLWQGAGGGRRGPGPRQGTRSSKPRHVAVLRTGGPERTPQPQRTVAFVICALSTQAPAAPGCRQ